MTTTVALLALVPSPGGGCRALARAADEPVVARLARQARGHGQVVVLTLPEWVEDVERVLPPGASVVEVASDVDAVSWLGEGTDDLLVLEADVVTGEVVLGRLGASVAETTGALVAPAEYGVGAPVRIARGHVVAAGSSRHRLSLTGQVSLGALRVTAADRSSLREAADALAAVEPMDPLRPALETAGAVSLVLVALVRTGVETRAVPLPRGLPWQRPAADREAMEAVERVEAADEDRALLDASVKEEDDFFTTFFVSTYSPYLARWFAQRGATPDQITVASLLVGLAAAGAFAVGERAWWVLGAVLLQAAFTLDCVDGQLARYTGRFSSVGAWLDSIFDRAKEYAVYAGLVVGGVRAGDDPQLLWLLAAAALALQTVRHAMDFGYAAQQEEDLARQAVRAVEALDDAGPVGWEPAAGHTGAGGGARASEKLAAGESPSQPTSPPDSQRRGSWPARVVATLRRFEDTAALKWAKRIVVLPIGERFLLLSLVTAVAHPRATFMALLVWGGIAAVYTVSGRVIRSLA